MKIVSQNWNLFTGFPFVGSNIQQTASHACSTSLAPRTREKPIRITQPTASHICSTSSVPNTRKRHSPTKFRSNTNSIPRFIFPLYRLNVTGVLFERWFFYCFDFLVKCVRINLKQFNIFLFTKFFWSMKSLNGC